MTKMKITFIIMAASLFTHFALAKTEESKMTKSDPNHLVKVILTAKNTNDRLAVKTPLSLSTSNPAQSSAIIKIDDSSTFQTIMGSAARSPNRRLMPCRK
jgi:hypothetical protein